MVGSAHGGESNRLLITGAAGNMGRLLRPLLRHDDRILRLGDIVEIDDAQPGDEVVNVDVRDPEAVARACVCLLSDWFPLTTGEIIHVDGGFHAVGA